MVRIEKLAARLKLAGHSGFCNCDVLVEGFGSSGLKIGGETPDVKNNATNTYHHEN
jgi:hypothetical protein